MAASEDPLQLMMTGMAEGDPAFLFAFVDEFGVKVRWVVRGILTDMGRTDLVASADELDGLTLDACEVIFRRAPGWRPGGARPWTWAFKAIRAEVARSIGHRVVPLTGDEDLDGEADSCTGGAVADPTGDDLGVLMQRHPAVRLLDEAIRSIGTRSVQDLYWEYRIQQGLGDPSPAHTLGERVGKTPMAVRQACKRHGDAVWRTVQADPRFDALLDHGWFAA